MSYLPFALSYIHRKNGETDTRISKRKLPDVLGKVKKIAFRTDKKIIGGILFVGKGPFVNTITTVL